MLKTWLEDFLNFIKTRTFILGVLFVFMIGILIHRLFVLQIVNGEDYLNRFTYRIQKDTEIQSPGVLFMTAMVRRWPTISCLTLLS